MHYKDGTEAKVGDIIKGPSGAGTLVQASANDGTCNGKMLRTFPVKAEDHQVLEGVFVSFDGPGLPPAIAAHAWASVTLGDCELLHRPETPKS